jgi:CRISPR-associated protein Cas5d
MLSCRIIGDRACFTNPHLNGERMSYDVPTGSALRQIIGSVYSKPEMRVIIREIQILNPIRRGYIKLNGLKFSPREVTNPQLNAKHRHQYNISFLENVDYRVFFTIQDEGCDREGANTPGKHAAIFRDRLAAGKHYKQAFLGMREFVGFVLEDFDDKKPIDHSSDYGTMLHDIIHPTKYNKLKQAEISWTRVKVQNGVIKF